jgi:hypothetical protein
LGGLHRHHDGFGSYDFEPLTPDLTAWPILPKHRETRDGFRHRWGSLRQRSDGY